MHSIQVEIDPTLQRQDTLTKAVASLNAKKEKLKLVRQSRGVDGLPEGYVPTIRRPSQDPDLPPLDLVIPIPSNTDLSDMLSIKLPIHDVLNSESGTGLMPVQELNGSDEEEPDLTNENDDNDCGHNNSGDDDDDNNNAVYEHDDDDDNVKQCDSRSVAQGEIFANDADEAQVACHNDTPVNTRASFAIEPIIYSHTEAETKLDTNANIDAGKELVSQSFTTGNNVAAVDAVDPLAVSAETPKANIPKRSPSRIVVEEFADDDSSSEEEDAKLPDAVTAPKEPWWGIRPTGTDTASSLSHSESRSVSFAAPSSVPRNKKHRPNKSLQVKIAGTLKSIDPPELQTLVTNVLVDVLKDCVYQVEKSLDWTENISSQILIGIAAMKPERRIIVHSMLAKDPLRGLHVQTSCHWSEGTDSSALVQCRSRNISVVIVMYEIDL
jgi:hypothetical protein